MNSKINDINRIEHIIENIEYVEKIVDNATLEEIIGNFEKRLALERALEIIGEATKHISEEILHDKQNTSPWRKIIGLRNILSHEYFRMDYDVIYEISKKDIVPLKKEILRIKNKLENE